MLKKDLKHYKIPAFYKNVIIWKKILKEKALLYENI